MFSVKDLKQRLETKDYNYIVYPEKKVCIEVDSVNSHVYVQTFGGIAYDHFPYEEYGYTDPYSFTEEWEVFGNSGRIEYEFDKDGLIREVCGGII